MTDSDENTVKASSRQRDDECRCGHRYGVLVAENDDDDADSKLSVPSTTDISVSTDRLLTKNTSPTTPTFPLDASFVQIPRSSAKQDQYPQRKNDKHHGLPDGSSGAPSPGFLDQYRHLSALEKAATSPNDPPRLCLSCVKRVERCLIADAERLERETEAFLMAVENEESNMQNWKRGLQIAETYRSPASTNDVKTDSNIVTNDIDEGPETYLEQREQEFLLEIELLQEDCKLQEAEITRLRILQKEQANVVKELDELENALEDEQNMLELEARAFDNDQELLSRSLIETQDEIQRLSSPQIRLPAILFELQVDKERGLRYPLINNLRLAYRPKGDIQWNEIETAWSLAAQLLLSVGSLFNFQSLNWRLVPLSHCAKLIYHPSQGSGDGARAQGEKQRTTVFNLGSSSGLNNCKAIIAWNALMRQVIQHTMSKMQQSVELGILPPKKLPRLPYETSSGGKIGDILLGRLDVNDDASWSRAIHCMACNLLWLSDCASSYILQRVQLTAAAFS